MNTSRFTCAVLAGAVSLVAAAAQSQSFPASGAPTQQQSNQQQQQPGVNQVASNSEAQEATASSGASGQSMKDKIFLRKAAEGGLAEVQLGQLASEKASAQEVKDFGSKMVTDHTELNTEMKPIAESMGVMLPKKLNAKDQAEYTKLRALSGPDFDTEYITYMVKDHHEDLREFRMEAANASDPALKAAVDKGAKVIREHSNMIDSLAKSKGIAVPARGPRAATPPAE